MWVDLESDVRLRKEMDGMAGHGYRPILVVFANAKGHIRLLAVDDLDVGGFLRFLATDTVANEIGDPEGLDPGH